MNEMERAQSFGSKCRALNHIKNTQIFKITKMNNKSKNSVKNFNFLTEFF